MCVQVTSETCPSLREEFHCYLFNIYTGAFSAEETQQYRNQKDCFVGAAYG